MKFSHFCLNSRDISSRIDDLISAESREYETDEDEFNYFPETGETIVLRPGQQNLVS